MTDARIMQPELDRSRKLARLLRCSSLGCVWSDTFVLSSFVVQEEYPAIAELESRCVNMIARLFNAPLDDEDSEALGVSTVGSSEAVMLAVLAAKRRWKHARKAAGKDFSSPNLVISSACHCVFEKACNYFEVEPRYWCT